MGVLHVGDSVSLIRPDREVFVAVICEADDGNGYHLRCAGLQQPLHSLTEFVETVGSSFEGTLRLTHADLKFNLARPTTQSLSTLQDVVAAYRERLTANGDLHEVLHGIGLTSAVVPSSRWTEAETPRYWIVR